MIIIDYPLLFGQILFQEVGSPFVHLIDPKENGQAGAAYQPPGGMGDLKELTFNIFLGNSTIKNWRR